MTRSTMSRPDRLRQLVSALLVVAGAANPAVSRPRRNGLRAMLSVPLAIGAVAVSLSVCTGAGIASATPTTNTDAINGALPPEVVDVTLRNGTNQPLVGEWHGQNGDYAADIDFRTPLSPGERRSKGMIVDPNPFHFFAKRYIWGRVCYNHKWFTFDRAEYQYGGKARLDFTLQPAKDGYGLEASIGIEGINTLPLIEKERGTTC
ncbi:hypothetical protein R3Q06_32350 [Rhodococcus erythropolis]|uniref:hypothetical protein n=1 Tax=Rhodococcus erythropolis TaxID=1833 RepID=UPI0029490641|nr:hypothetical protein [Rhodococcus erythropolis]MDV6278161.1 hypothetical protein [Rhodococcus erythropolis]